MTTPFGWCRSMTTPTISFPPDRQSSVTSDFLFFFSNELKSATLCCEGAGGIVREVRGVQDGLQVTQR